MTVGGFGDAGAAALDRFVQLAAARRTSLMVDPDAAVPAQLVDRLVEAATWAPNHKRNWPWRFTVVTGAGRGRLGAALADAAIEAGFEDAKVAKLRTKYERSPVVLLLWAAADPDPVRHGENRDAVAAATEHVLLGATAAGLGSHWASVPEALHPAVREVAGVAPDDQLVALVYLGWPTGEVTAPPRPAPDVGRVG